MIKNINKQRVEELLKGTESAIIVTDNGIALEGKMLDLMKSLSMLVAALKEDGVDKELLKFSFETGIEFSKDKNNGYSSIIDNEIKKALKELRNDLNSFLGDK